MARTGDRPFPLFSYTAYSAFAGLAVGAVLFIIWLIWVISPGLLALKPPNLVLAAFVLLFDLVLLSVETVSLTVGVWNVRFFENEFTVRAKGLRKTFTSAGVADLHTYLLFSGFRQRQVLRMDIPGGRTLTVTGNPKNTVLKTDLYDWLKGRLEGSRVVAQTPRTPTQAV